MTKLAEILLVTVSVAILPVRAQETHTMLAGDADDRYGALVDETLQALERDNATPVVYRKTYPASAFSLRNNLFWDASGTPNLGLEVGIGEHFGLGLNAGFKWWNRFFPWQKTVDASGEENFAKWRNLTIAPEFRWWFGPRGTRHFAGLDLLWIHYNVGGIRFPLGLYPNVRDTRVQGDIFGGGLFYGYAFPLGRHWRLELEGGAGLGWYRHDTFECATCGSELGRKTGLSVIPKLGLNIVYTIDSNLQSQ